MLRWWRVNERWSEKVDDWWIQTCKATREDESELMKRPCKAASKTAESGSHFIKTEA